MVAFVEKSAVDAFATSVREAYRGALKPGLRFILWNQLMAQGLIPPLAGTPVNSDQAAAVANRSPLFQATLCEPDPHFIPNTNMTTQTSTLPELASDYPLTKQQIVQFQRDGHILLRGVATKDEIAAYRPVILAARDKYGQEATPLEQRDTYGKAFLKGMNLLASRRRGAQIRLR